MYSVETNVLAMQCLSTKRLFLVKQPSFSPCMIVLRLEKALPVTSDGYMNCGEVTGAMKSNYDGLEYTFYCHAGDVDQAHALIGCAGMYFTLIQ